MRSPRLLAVLALVPLTFALTPQPALPVVVSPTAVTAAPFLPYSADSYFRTPWQARAGIDTAATVGFRQFMATHPDQKATPYPVIRGTGGNAWGMTYAEGNASDPVWRLTGTVPSSVTILKTQGFRAPEWFGAMLTGTSDSPFVVVDRATGWSVWGAKAKVVGDHLVQVGAAGLYEHASNGLHRKNALTTSRVNFRARGAIPDSAVIRKDLLDWGVATGGDLGHVLHLYFVETSTVAGFRHPMVGTESGKAGWGAEGQRIAIDPAVDLTTRGLTPEALVIARTLQRYGAYIGDNAGGPTSLKAEQENGVRSVWGGRLPKDALRGLRWDDFVALSGG